MIVDDGCRIWTSQTGEGQVLLLCHGGPGVWDYFADLAGLLAGLGQIVRWDQRGCGRSSHRGPYSVARSTADLDAVCHGTAREQVTLLGHSWGASLALLYTLKHPNLVKRLIYVSGTGIDPGSTWASQFRRNLRRQLGAHLPRWEELKGLKRTAAQDLELTILQWSADFVQRDAALGHAKRMATPWFGINRECNDTISAEMDRLLESDDVVRSCRALEVPALIVDGEHDIRPRWAVDSLEAALPNVERVQLKNAGHMPWVEQPHDFREAIAGFLGR